MFGFFKSSKTQPDPAAQVAAESVAAPAKEAAPTPKPSWAQRLKIGLARTRTSFTGQIAGLFGVGAKIDEELFEELETVLLSADVGVEATQHLIGRLRGRVKRDRLSEASQLRESLKEELSELLAPLERALDRDYRVVTYIIEHATDLELASVENKLLVLDYRLMRLWSRLTRTMAPHQSRQALSEMAAVLSVLAGQMGSSRHLQMEA